jgi:AraC family transcriptional regulator of adaptative response/methylated-DNA-[protein]-cysteine methyltransferase
MHSMLLSLPSHETLYAALLARDPAYDGHVFVCVETTKVFCRLTCPARKPKSENTRFYDSAAQCFENGFRPCLRCRPLDRAREREPLVAELMDRLDREPERSWSEEDLLAMDLDPSTVRRAFKRHIGMTFLDLARLRQTGRGLERIAGGASVIDAQLEAGFESGSGFREAVTRLIGDCPAELRGRELLRADWIETPIGPMLAVADRHALHLLEFFDRKALPSELSRLRERTRSSIAFGRLPPIDGIEAELSAYFGGRSATFTTPLACHGSDLTRKVWDMLCEIPLGTTRSYAQIADRLRLRSGARAVARANGANQIAIAIPCHRVIGTNGDLTGYGGGLWRKRWLLEHERRLSARTHSS